MVALTALEVLDVSRNQLRELPSWISRLTSLREVHAAKSSSSAPSRGPSPSPTSPDSPTSPSSTSATTKNSAPPPRASPRSSPPSLSCEVRLTAERKGEGALAGLCEPAAREIPPSSARSSPR